MRIVPRKEWGSKSKFRFGKMKTANAVWLHHDTLAVQGDSVQDMRELEAVGIARFGQLSYSFAFHPDGTIFQGCDEFVGAHTENRNSTSFGLVLMGNYEGSKVPTLAQIDGVRFVISELQAQGRLRLGTYPTGGHRDVAATACPGKNAYSRLNEFRVPWVEPTPPVPPPVVLPIGEVEVDVILKSIRLDLVPDIQGKGWIKIPYTADKIVSLIPHSGTRPGTDGSYDNTPNHVSMTPEGPTEGFPFEGTIIVLQGGTPGASNPIWIQVIE